MYDKYDIINVHTCHHTTHQNSVHGYRMICSVQMLQVAGLSYSLADWLTVPQERYSISIHTLC